MRIWTLITNAILNDDCRKVLSKHEGHIFCFIGVWKRWTSKATSVTSDQDKQKNQNISVKTTWESVLRKRNKENSRFSM